MKLYSNDHDERRETPRLPRRHCCYKAARLSPTWNGIYAIDAAELLPRCAAQPVTLPDGMAGLVQMQVSDEGGWCGETLSHNGVAYDSYLLVTRQSTWPGLVPCRQRYPDRLYPGSRVNPATIDLPCA